MGFIIAAKAVDSPGAKEGVRVLGQPQHRNEHPETAATPRICPSVSSFQTSMHAERWPLAGPGSAGTSLFRREGGGGGGLVERRAVLKKLGWNTQLVKRVKKPGTAHACGMALNPESSPVAKSTGQAAGRTCTAASWQEARFDDALKSQIRGPMQSRPSAAAQLSSCARIAIVLAASSCKPRREAVAESAYYLGSA